MSVSDNFDYSIKTIKKGDTMYLSTLNNNDIQIKPFKKLNTKRDWSANLYNLDIESSMPRKFGIYTNKTDYINKLDDIERTNPKILHYPLDKPNYNLSNSDIEKSSPKLNQLKTNRCLNPLEPKYILPKVEDYPPEEKKFIRNTLDIKDIWGTHPQKFIKWKTRETFPLDNFGISGSKTKKPYIRKNIGNNIKYHYIDYSDLTVDIFKTKRNTNPLDPIYYVNKNAKNEILYGPIEKSKPQTMYKFMYKPVFNLKLDDIEGTNIGSKNKINKFNGKNFEFNVSDIEGCKTGSLKKGIVTNRCTNPLMPNYQLLGAKELSGAKNGEFSKKNKNMEKINDKNIDDKNDNKKNIVSEKEPKMMKLNDLPNVVNIKTEPNENFNKTCYNNNNDNKINFNNKFNGNKTNYNSFRKPEPFYGFNHDPNLQSTESPVQRQKIEDNKKIKAVMFKTARSEFFNLKDKDLCLIDNNSNRNYSVSPPRPNRTQYGNFANCLGGVGKFNFDKNSKAASIVEKNENNLINMKIMNKTSHLFGPLNKTYEEKLDTFMSIKNNLNLDNKKSLLNLKQMNYIPPNANNNIKAKNSLK